MLVEKYFLSTSSRICFITICFIFSFAVLLHYKKAPFTKISVIILEVGHREKVGLLFWCLCRAASLWFFFKCNFFFFIEIHSWESQNSLCRLKAVSSSDACTEAVLIHVRRMLELKRHTSAAIHCWRRRA